MMSMCVSVCIQLQQLVTDVTCIQLMELFSSHQQLVTSLISSQQLSAAETSYQRKAEQLMTDENCFRLMLVKLLLLLLKQLLLTVPRAKLAIG